MKKILFFFIILLFSGCSDSYSEINLICGGNLIKIDNKYIYQYFGSGAVDKYKISNRNSSLVAGSYKGKNWSYDVFVDLTLKTLRVNTKDRSTGIAGGYSRDCR